MFKAWAEADAGMLWIKGKPGSGKSVMMKLIRQDERTGELLDSIWGGTYIRIGFFFWHSGTPLQRSREGLLRKLLLGVLQRRPEMSDVLQPIISASTSAATSPSLTSTFWNLERLSRCLRLLLEQNLHNINLCFFLDALDEYGGSPEWIAQFVQDMGMVRASTSRTRIKICFSSRPWSIFEEKLSDHPTITLQDHTRDDIRQYCLGMTRDNTAAVAPIRELVDEVVDLSAGVFLWVRLVVEDLRAMVEQGAREGTIPTIPELRRALESFPQTLAEFYALRVVQRVPERYRLKMYAILECVYHGRSFGVPLGLLDTAHAVECWIHGQTYQAYREVITRIDHLGDQEKQRQAELLLAESSGGLVENVRGRPTFMHRSVADFVASIEFKRSVLGNLAPDVYENGLAINFKYLIGPRWEKPAKGILYKVLVAINDDISIRLPYYDDSWRLGYKSEKTTGQSLGVFLDSIPDTALEKPELLFKFFTGQRMVPKMASVSSNRPILEYAAFFGLSLYIRERIDKEPALLRYADRLILLAAGSDTAEAGVAVARVLLEKGYDAARCGVFGHILVLDTYCFNVSAPEVACLLLRHGFNPSTPIADRYMALRYSWLRSAWHRFPVRTALHMTGNGDIIQELLHHNADPNALDSTGATPLDCLVFNAVLIRSRPYREILLLVQHGGRTRKTTSRRWRKMQALIAEPTKYDSQHYDTAALQPGFSGT